MLQSGAPLSTVIHAALNSITENQCNSWITHSGYPLWSLTMYPAICTANMHHNQCLMYMCMLDIFQLYSISLALLQAKLDSVMQSGVYFHMLLCLQWLCVLDILKDGSLQLIVLSFRYCPDSNSTCHFDSWSMHCIHKFRRFVGEVTDTDLLLFLSGMTRLFFFFLFIFLLLEKQKVRWCIIGWPLPWVYHVSPTIKLFNRVTIFTMLFLY